MFDYTYNNNYTIDEKKSKIQTIKIRSLKICTC